MKSGLQSAVKENVDGVVDTVKFYYPELWLARMLLWMGLGSFMFWLFSQNS